MHIKKRKILRIFLLWIACILNVKNITEISVCSRFNEKYEFSKVLLGDNVKIYDKENNKIINYAYSFIGKPYRYGANGPNEFDCSGYTKYVYSNFSKNLPRTSQEQYDKGKKIDKNDLQVGDLVFFNTNMWHGHVGIYLGNDEFIHASSSKGVTVSLLSNGYYFNKYAGAVRY